MDEVALGAWLTPVINAVSPAQMDPGSNETFTITGENFLDPVVRLGNVQLDQVTWLDEHTLLASLPATILPGVYDLWVVNSGGQAAVLPGGFRVGRALYLPAVEQISGDFSR